MGQLPGNSFAVQIENWTRKVAFRERSVFVGTASEVLRSIQEGSELTGSPGQPVDVGTLRASWQLSFPGEHTAQISTNLDYAKPNEDGVSATGGTYVQKSPVGGRHSVALTRAGFDRIVESEVRKVQQS